MTKFKKGELDPGSFLSQSLKIPGDHHRDAVSKIVNLYHDQGQYNKILSFPSSLFELGMMDYYDSDL